MIQKVNLQQAHNEECHLDCGYDSEPFTQAAMLNAVRVERLAEDNENQPNSTQNEDAKLINGFHCPVVHWSCAVDTTVLRCQGDGKLEQDAPDGGNVDRH